LVLASPASGSIPEVSNIGSTGQITIFLLRVSSIKGRTGEEGGLSIDIESGIMDLRQQSTFDRLVRTSSSENSVFISKPALDSNSFYCLFSFSTPPCVPRQHKQAKILILGYAEDLMT
jgi:hypothetical protein